MTKECDSRFVEFQLGKSSTLSRGCTSCNTCSFKGLKSTHMQTDPDFLCTTTMPAHHGVGVSTREMTSSDSILVRSSNFLEQGNRDIAGSEQCKGLGIWLQLNLKALLVGAKSSE